MYFMEIRDSRSPLLLVPFANMKAGETFMSGPNLFLRAVAAITEPNAVSLIDGRLARFSLDDEVLPIKAYIVKEP